MGGSYSASERQVTVSDAEARSLDKEDIDLVFSHNEKSGGGEFDGDVIMSDDNKRTIITYRDKYYIPCPLTHTPITRERIFGPNFSMRLSTLPCGCCYSLESALCYCGETVGDADKVLKNGRIPYKENTFLVAKTETNVLRLQNLPSDINEPILVLLLEKFCKFPLASCPSVHIDHKNHEAKVTFSCCHEAAKIDDLLGDITHKGSTIAIRKEALPVIASEATLAHDCCQVSI
ncbi:hypothetical protein CAPTEDRAFT_203142 [Capitella teleta]|uniref:Uncharacterized protein n=1 Tax=Capitella teleta TaxID=283909 RepID=R7TFT3_CAPTE|nr:hypothetical protein CAPTEDRAFT_203142 [Capitella teleta]|eukprot:ELT89906.1 hypothetical protein CAPTEDRAFT_203142 [Capitella teleta]